MRLCFPVWPQVFAPFVDVGLYPTPRLLDFFEVRNPVPMVCLEVGQVVSIQRPGLRMAASAVLLDSRHCRGPLAATSAAPSGAALQCHSAEPCLFLAP